MGAYLLPAITSMSWLYNGKKPDRRLISASNLLVWLRLILFFRFYRHLGVYFAIILGVAKKVFPFLVIVFSIILSFSYAFYILLKPEQDFTMDVPTFNNDSNNPWNLTNKYYTFFN